MRINPQTGVTELAQITQTATGQVSINWVPLPPSANHSQPWTPSLAAIPEVDEEEGPQR
ncbi:MAG TPA: hypothetical protein VHO47_02160 [Candidatus Babeliales bacterium]|nr:hypothetical protein [Candidatus Babeliales bacterium]